MENFKKLFSDEEACRKHFKDQRERKGIICYRCKHNQHYWLKGKEQWQCKKCDTRTTLRSGTFMHASNMPVLSWYVVIYALIQNQFSARYIQQKILKHKRYEPVWAMGHKLRVAMGEIIDKEILDKLNIYAEDIKALGFSMELKIKEELQKAGMRKTNSRSILAYDFLRENILEKNANQRLKRLKYDDNFVQLPDSGFQNLMALLEERIRKINRQIKIDYLRHYVNELLHAIKSKKWKTHPFDELIFAVTGMVRK